MSSIGKNVLIRFYYQIQFKYCARHINHVAYQLNSKKSTESLCGLLEPTTNKSLKRHKKMMMNGIVDEEYWITNIPTGIQKEISKETIFLNAPFDHSVKLN